MKTKLFGLVLGLVAALLIIVAASGQVEQPPAPTCLEGQVTTTPAVWVEDVVQVIHHDEIGRAHV